MGRGAKRNVVIGETECCVCVPCIYRCVLGERMGIRIFIWFASGCMDRKLEDLIA